MFSNVMQMSVKSTVTKQMQRQSTAHGSGGKVVFAMPSHLAYSRLAIIYCFERFSEDVSHIMRDIVKQNLEFLKKQQVYALFIQENRYFYQGIAPSSSYFVQK